MSDSRNTYAITPGDTLPEASAQRRATVRNGVLRNTYLLLGMTLAVSAVTAGAALAGGAPARPWWMTLAG